MTWMVLASPSSTTGRMPCGCSSLGLRTTQCSRRWRWAAGRGSTHIHPRGSWHSGGQLEGPNGWLEPAGRGAGKQGGRSGRGLGWESHNPANLDMPPSRPLMTGLLGVTFILWSPLVHLVHPTAHLVCLLGYSECQASLGREVCMLGGVSTQLKFLGLFGAGAHDQGSMGAMRAGLFSEDV